jgi:hypothetical protein
VAVFTKGIYTYVKLSGTHQLLVYADDVDLLRDNIDAIKKNMETLIDASKEVCCCLVARMQVKIMT